MLTADEVSALLLSLKVSSAAVAFSLPFAVAAALLLSRSFPGKILLDGIVHVPLVLPPVAMGFILLTLFGTRAGLGALLWNDFGIRLVFRWTGAALAGAIITFPFQVRAVRLGLEAQDRGLGEAARSLGAGWSDRLLNVTLPLALPAILAGAVTAFAASLGEFGAIITFVSNIPGETRTLPLAIYSALQSPGGEAEAARLSAMSIGLALALMVVAQVLARHAARKDRA